MIHIRINDGVAEVELQENGVSIWKDLGSQALIEAFLKATGKVLEKAVLKTPMLPPGTLSYQEIDEDTYHLFLHVPAHRESNFAFENTRYEDVGIPNLIFRIRVSSQVVVTSSVWCMHKKTLIAPDTRLYHWPLYNVSDSGGICLGGSNRLIVEHPWQLFRWPGYFFSQSMTAHGTPRNNSGLEGRSLMQALSGRDFPDEWLVPMNRTIQSVLFED